MTKKSMNEHIFGPDRVDENFLKKMFGRGDGEADNIRRAVKGRTYGLPAGFWTIEEWAEVLSYEFKEVGAGRDISPKLLRRIITQQKKSAGPLWRWQDTLDYIWTKYIDPWVESEIIELSRAISDMIHSDKLSEWSRSKLKREGWASLLTSIENMAGTDLRFTEGFMASAWSKLLEYGVPPAGTIGYDYGIDKYAQGVLLRAYRNIKKAALSEYGGTPRRGRPDGRGPSNPQYEYGFMAGRKAREREFSNLNAAEDDLRQRGLG